ncbi:MAG TPA: hypothetical protein VMH39_01070 [Gemmatimonadaceae bacterium]|nr:hypothetical protein [Gemmatimonadaceae bacterium]
MTRGPRLRFRRVSLLAAVAAVVGIAACEEHLGGGNACPLVCPEQAVAPRDTTVFAVVIDTSIAGFPPIGNESNILIAFHKDTFETAGIFRYDSVPNFYQIPNTTRDTAIYHIDSAFLVAPRATADTSEKFKAPVTIEAFDVSAVDDTAGSALLPLFTPNHLLGTVTYAPDSIRDTLRIPINANVVFNRMQNATRLRVGVRVRSDSSVDLRFASQQVGTGVVLNAYVTTGDSTQPPVSVPALSKTPVNPSFLATALGDFTVALTPQAPPPACVVRVGDFPWRRLYLRFALPRSIVDSTAIIRATLMLTQRPNRNAVAAGDSITVFPSTILSSPVVQDITAALQFATPAPFPLGTDTVTPRDSGLRRLEIVNLVRAWEGVPDSVTPRVVAIQVVTEGNFAGAVDFYSLCAPASVRPQIRLTYVPKPKLGFP